MCDIIFKFSEHWKMPLKILLSIRIKEWATVLFLDQIFWMTWPEPFPCLQLDNLFFALLSQIFVENNAWVQKGSKSFPYWHCLIFKSFLTLPLFINSVIFFSYLKSSFSWHLRFFVAGQCIRLQGYYLNSDHHHQL